MAKKQKSEVATRTLYRPVGLYEMEKILKADARAFPPRFPDQPIFYPVLNYDYAEQIARDWNTKDANSRYAGFVTAFEVDAQFLEQFETHTVGAKGHQELWIPSEQLDEFNQHIHGRIEVKAAFYGEAFKDNTKP
jgi:hypothetical protein